jgi:hypothetical protein
MTNAQNIMDRLRHPGETLKQRAARRKANARRRAARHKLKKQD